MKTIGFIVNLIAGMRGAVGQARSAQSLKDKKEKMSKITSPVDAEARARQFIKDKHPTRTVRRILLRRTSKEGGVWLLEGEVWFKRLLFFTVRKFFRLQISVEAGELISYEERKGAQLSNNNTPKPTNK